MVVVAAEEYAARYNLKTSETFRLFDTHAEQSEGSPPEGVE
jgi:hypothetical protein